MKFELHFYNSPVVVVEADSRRELVERHEVKFLMMQSIWLYGNAYLNLIEREDGITEVHGVQAPDIVPVGILAHEVSEDDTDITHCDPMTPESLLGLMFKGEKFHGEITEDGKVRLVSDE